jgi:hypothetical protein
MSHSLLAQETVSDERAAMERLEGSIQIVLNMDPQFQAKHLELVDDQKAQLEKLRASKKITSAIDHL